MVSTNMANAAGEHNGSDDVVCPAMLQKNSDDFIHHNRIL